MPALLDRRIDALRASEYWYLDAEGRVYLDYTGAGLPAQAQLTAHTSRMHGRCFGNPHSVNPASAASTELIERARHAVLAHFNASPDEYVAIFTANASAACRLVGEAYPFGMHGRLVLTSDNHNSVNGIREFARTRGAVTSYVPPKAPDLRIGDDAIRAALTPARSRGLFAYPAQSNFSGVRHPLAWIDIAHEQGYDVLLDAAAYVPSHPLDLSRYQPDFVPVSWYKVFGYPTGVGCLIARREALARLQRPWFAGGTISAASVAGDWHDLADGETRFEDGTPSFLQVPDVEFGLTFIQNIGLDEISQHVKDLTEHLLGGLGALRHRNGEPMIRVHGPSDTRDRGGTVAFSLLDPHGTLSRVRDIEQAAADAGICVRTGCFCNPGAAEAAFGFTGRDPRQMPGGGAVRASVGLASNLDDVRIFLTWLEETYAQHPVP
jgi:selenocysteine lyase/cysteine desulfurase